MRPESAMIFAAGFGTRMGGLTQSTPKPLLHAAGATLLDHALAQIRDAGITNIVINTHYLADQIIDHVRDMTDVQVIVESPQILDTGGGLRNALPLLGVGPVITLNADYVWAGESPIKTLLQAWKSTKSDALLLVTPIDNATAYLGYGDFSLSPDGTLESKPTGPKKFVYTGAQILKPERLCDITETVFSLTRLWAILQKEHRLLGCQYKGGWIDVGHPAGIKAADDHVHQRQGDQNL